MKTVKWMEWLKQVERRTNSLLKHTNLINNFGKMLKIAPRAMVKGGFAVKVKVNKHTPRSWLVVFG